MVRGGGGVPPLRGDGVRRGVGSSFTKGRTMLDIADMAEPQTFMEPTDAAHVLGLRPPRVRALAEEGPSPLAEKPAGGRPLSRPGDGEGPGGEGGAEKAS